MDYIKELMQVGDDVLYTVTSAIENNDFSNLSSDLKNRFGEFAEDIKADARMRTNGIRARGSYHDKNMYWYDPKTGQSGTSWTADPELHDNNAGQMSGGAGYRYRENAGMYSGGRTQRALTPFRPRIFGKASSILKMITGIAGMVLFPDNAAVPVRIISAFPSVLRYC